MSHAKAALSFDEIIQADRQRRKNEELANEIFGRSRKVKDNGRDLEKKQSRTPSLASRVGVAKRSNSSTNVKPSFNPPSRPSSATANIARTNRLATAVNNRQQANVSTPPLSHGPGLSIKGAAGPFVVEASNFAPGTTAADIESALQTIVTDTNGPIESTSCRIMSINPTIVAEMVFVEKAMADAVIKTFNGQKADGRILHVHHKRTTAGLTPATKNETASMSDNANAAPGKDLFSSATAGDLAEEAMEDVEMATEPVAYSDERDRSDRERRDRDRDRDREPKREGVEEHMREDRNGSSRRDDRDRERDRDHDHNRDRNGDRDRDRDRDSRRYDDRRYERREDRGSSSRGYGPPAAGGFDQRGGRPYGNGMGGFHRGGGAGSGMYNDGMAGSPRGGGFRGSYRGYGRGRGF